MAARLTDLISPVKPTSPNASTSSGTTISFRLLTRASDTAKSVAGSSNLNPPITLIYASMLEKKYPHFFSSTANSIDILL